jgi:hypothetical protein
MRPLFTTTMRSATSSASSWSWVTKTLVSWISSCRRRSHRRSSRRTLASSAPNGLVEQQDLGLDRQRTGQRDALALPARELVGVALGQPFELDQVEERAHLLLDRRVGGALGARAHAQAEGDVLEDRHVPEERVVLEHEAHVAVLHALVGGVLTLDQHATGIGSLEARDYPQQRGLARARRTQEGHQLAGRDLERNVGEGLEAAEALGDVLDLDGHGSFLSTHALSARVTSASSASNDAHAKAAANWYSL